VDTRRSESGHRNAARIEIDRVEIDQVGVVVPAHNEARGLPPCLRGLAAAADAADVPVSVVVVLDSCTDDSAAVAAQVLDGVCLQAVCITTNAATVGGARRDGVQHLLQKMRWIDPARLWIATTDADSVVPTHWLHAHVSRARAGAEIVAGTVDVDDWTNWPAGVADTYRQQYDVRLAGDGHGHIHGANLGIRADTYLAVGGFSPVPGDEDVDLIRRAQGEGVAVTWALNLAVQTSARRVGRAPSGFARHLHELASHAGNVLPSTVRPTDGAAIVSAPTPDRWRSS
jgi:cellulose synthase/poly-beta-1,6-N-acetylglucosamine synthase-like glycosyltransferase